MAFANVDDSGPPLFAAVLTPHRSLSSSGLRIVLVVLAVLSLAVGTTFFLLGAWPVPGFLGLDVVAVSLAFRLSFRSARIAEEISLSRARLRVRRVAADGSASVTDFNPYWTRLEVHRWPPFGVTHLAIASGSQELAIGAFLGPGEREALVTALSAALAAAKVNQAG